MAEREVAAALQRLRALGFKPAVARTSLRAFDGVLKCKRGDVAIRIEISDWDFTRYPTIRIRDRPSFFPSLMPHISANGVLCYFAEGSVVLDRYRPDDAVFQCLEQARLVIDQAIDDPQHRADEFRGEFWINWAIAQKPEAPAALIGTIDPDGKVLRCRPVGPNSRLYVSSHADDASQFCGALGWNVDPTEFPCWAFRSDLIPAVPEAGLPATVHDAFAWLKLWDPGVYRQTQDVLAQREYLKWSRCVFAFATPSGWIGFSFGLDSMRARGYAKKPREYRNYLHNKGGSTPIQRLVFEDVSALHVYGRSLAELDQETLAGKKIAIIGCGAIGGYLGPALVRLGAGIEGGMLLLQDIDALEADNLGRHRLGYESLFANKAVALKASLGREAPFAKINATTKSGLASFPNGFDLIINATGDQAVAEGLNAHHAQSKMDTPLLHLWVFGNGDCVQGLWVDSPKHACYRCLRHNDEAQYRAHRFPLTDEPPVRAFVGCHAFTPYAIAAPMSAAALGCDFVSDWMRGDVSPRFRTRYSENAHLHKIKSQNVPPLKGCPACGAR